MEKNEQLIYLLRGEHHVFLKAKDAVKSSSFSYSIPLDYADQIPILLESDGDFLSYEIINEKLPPNKIIKFILPPLKKDEKIKIHFEYWVLTFNTQHKNLPQKPSFPQSDNIPDDVKKWLVSTESIQKNNILIKIIASVLKGINKDILWFAKKIAFWNAYHGLITIRLKTAMVHNRIAQRYLLPEKYWWYLEDAISTLLFGALCSGRANLIAALLRAKGIPARIVVTTPTTMGKKNWLDAQHYTVEFYCPEKGWVRTQSGIMPHLSKYIIPIRIVSIDEENIAGGPFSFYGGMAPWFWTDNKNVVLDCQPKEFRRYNYHKSKETGTPVTRGWIDSRLMIPLNVSKEMFKISQDIWTFFIDNINRYDNKHELLLEKAIEYQKKAISFLKKSDFNNYIKNLKKSKDLYIKFSERVKI